MVAGGMAPAVAKAIAGALGSGGSRDTPPQARVVEGLTGGEALAEFLIDWDVTHVFGLAGSEEVGFLDALAQMGCVVERGARAITVRGAPKLRGIRIDANTWSDSALALAVVALFAEGPTEIVNVANLRIKETDRLAALECELAKLGARATAGRDSLRIEPGPLRGAEIDTYDDHRMAMSFAIAGLRSGGVTINDPKCVNKTFPEYFAYLERLRHSAV